MVDGEGVCGCVVVQHPRRSVVAGDVGGQEHLVEKAGRCFCLVRQCVWRNRIGTGDIDVVAVPQKPAFRVHQVWQGRSKNLVDTGDVAAVGMGPKFPSCDPVVLGYGSYLLPMGDGAVSFADQIEKCKAQNSGF